MGKPFVLHKTKQQYIIMKDKSKKILKNLKKKSKTLRMLLKITSICTIVMAFISCKNNCDKELLAVLDAAKKGNVEIVESYINNGGDFSDSCFDYKAGRLGGTRDVLTSSLQSESIELMKLVLENSDELGNNSLSRMINVALKQKDDNFLKLLIQDYNAHIRLLSHNKFYSLDELKKMAALGYDFNWIHPHSGNTILMTYVSDRNSQNEEKLLETVKYLVANGAKLDIKNKKGLTVKDLVVNEEVKEYLESFE